MTTDERIGTNVHELLWRQKKRQQVLMTALGISRSGLAKKLRGEIVWKAEDIEQAAQALDVDPGRLFVDPRRMPATGQDDVSKTIWSRLATVHPIRPGMTDVTFERLPRKAAG